MSGVNDDVEVVKQCIGSESWTTRSLFKGAIEPRGSWTFSLGTQIDEAIGRTLGDSSANIPSAVDARPFRTSLWSEKARCHNHRALLFLWVGS